MKVICIDASAARTYTELKEGEIYDVVLGKSHCGYDTYVINENGYKKTTCKCGILHGSPMYRATRFIPLSTIDELELVNLKEECL